MTLAPPAPPLSTAYPGGGPAATACPATVVLDQVRKRFGRHNALDGLNLAIAPGQITVLLGPNGAGKTTAIRVVTGAMRPDSGTVTTFGLDPFAHGETVRRRCGVVSAKPALYDRLDGWDNLRYAAALYGIDPQSPALGEAAERFGIRSALDQKVGAYSTGMKTRLALARAVLHEPELLLLDEPTSGLDPESSYAVLELIRELARSGSTVLLCTHLLAEAEGLADRVVVLEEGRDLAAGAPEELMRRWWPDPVVRLGTAPETPLRPDLLLRIPGVKSASLQPDGTIEAAIDHSQRVVEVVTTLVRWGARVNRVVPQEPTLEDLYFAVRGVTRGAMTAVEAER
jgi:ABC-2 type transport system ATP-binding protein